jgi:oligopeptide transport system substrate-binding protein
VTGKKTPAKGEQELQMSYVTRRDFLKIGGTGLAGVALLGITSCGTGGENAQQGTGKPIEGGTLQATLQQDPPSLDPAIGYDTVTWPLEHAIFVTLITYNRTAKEFVPWAAKTVPEEENGGKRYVFDIKPGIKFTNGEPVDAAAFKYAIQRILDPQTKSPLAGFYTNIVGAKDYQDNPGGDLAGIEVLSPTKLQFDLENADQTFLQTMSIPSASAVPKKAVQNLGDDFGSKPVTSGPFKVQQWQRGSKLILVKYQDYFDKDAATKLDEIDFTLGLDPHTELLRVEQGSADYTFDGIPTADFNTVVNNPQWENYIHHATINELGYVYMNTQMRPFDNPKVREAMQYAIDKKHVLQVLNNRGAVANQVLPPRMPGYDESINDIPYDPEKAKSLLKEAGYQNGIDIDYWNSNEGERPKIDQAIQADLSKVGIKANLTSVSLDAYVGKMQTGTIQSGFSIWTQDFPDPSDFLNLLFNSSGIPATNQPKYSNPEVDRELDQAQYMPNETKRLQLYQKIQKQILSDHPIVPLYYTVTYDFVSPKVGGFYIHPVWHRVYADWYLTK